MPKQSHSKKDGLPEAVKQVREKVVLKEFRVDNASSTDFPGNYPGIDDSWDLDAFKETFKMNILSLDDESMEFDFVGIDAAVANASRRILLAEVATMAIESVFIFNNTSVIPDELLAHRLGLIPLFVDPRRFKFKGDGEATDENTIVFELNVKCDGKPKDKGADTNSHVLSKHLTWVPQGNQLEVFGEDAIKPVHDDILIAKLRPGQEISCQLHCEKGIGKQHAKWSPVATASYRLMPHIDLKRDYLNDEAERLQKCFSQGVIELKPCKEGKKAVVKSARNDTMSREVLRHADLKDGVSLERVRNHFIFSVESTGALPPDVLVAESLKVLIRKCDTLLNVIDSATDVPDQ